MAAFGNSAYEDGGEPLSVVAPEPFDVACSQEGEVRFARNRIRCPKRAF